MLRRAPGCGRLVHPESEAARAALALPEGPEQILAAIAQTTWNIGCMDG